MRTFRLVMIAAGVACATSAMAGDIAPGGTLRAAYLGTNPAQAMRDPATGEVRGPAYDLARELARRNNVPLEFKPIAGPPAVIEAVKNAEADIGFVAYEATRLGTVDFSQTYMLVRQSFLVLDGSPIKAIADIDRAGQKIAGTVNDSITLCMKRILKQATIVELANDPAELSKALTARTIDAFGANRQRLTTFSTATPGTRLLPDDLFNVPEYRRAEGPAGGARGGECVDRRGARIGLPAERDRARRRHRGRGRAGRRESRMSGISDARHARALDARGARGAGVRPARHFYPFGLPSSPRRASVLRPERVLRCRNATAAIPLGAFRGCSCRSCLRGASSRPRCRR